MIENKNLVLPSGNELEVTSRIERGELASVDMEAIKGIINGVANGAELKLISYAPKDTPYIYAILTYQDNDMYEIVSGTFVDKKAISILVTLLSTAPSSLTELVSKNKEYLEEYIHQVEPSKNFLLEFFKDYSERGIGKLQNRIKGGSKVNTLLRRDRIRSYKSSSENIFVLTKEFLNGSISFRLSLDDAETEKFLKENHFIHDKKLI